MYAQVTGKSELKIEVEKITYNAHVKMLVVYTGKLAWISSRDTSEYMENHVFDVSLRKAKDKNYQLKLLRSLLDLWGAGLFVDAFGLAKRHGGRKKNICKKILNKKREVLTEEEQISLRRMLKGKPTKH